VEEIRGDDVPLHPYVMTFDLKKHRRQSVHVNGLEVYEYDEQMSDKLVLPEEQKRLITMLVEHKDAGFRDIVAGKTGGAVVLLAGPPGVGKTLTAEVYAETERKALYSVQCSQLGTDPNTLEQSLMSVFSRAKRWDAVLLLDEADVYVHERGNDIQQNAIVGVFLRVLEYTSTVMFLTTNRPQDVDDAVASRCLARIVYKVPGEDERQRIWAVLAQVAGAELHKDVRKFSQANRMSGRDVKNMLKLAMLVAKGEVVTEKTLEFVKQFQP
jgi:SpoVK/Ycf46/Vps4 family AAA+-type ATPase